MPKAIPPYPMRSRLKNILPAPLRPVVRNSLDTIGRAREWPAATFHPQRRESIARLAALKDIHQGERCFIMGNGPSLKNTDVSKLRDEFTFGMNRVYLAFEEWGFSTNYLVSVNSLVIEQCVQDFINLDIPKFFSWRSRDYFGLQSLPPNLHFLHTTYTGPTFAQDVRGRLWEGATVTYVCLQLAFHMGFETAILIGVDHSFATKGKPNTTVVSQGDDPNHFDAGYFGKGFRWQLPDLDTSEIGYHLANQTYGQAGRQVIDATVNGHLQIFPKADYESLF